MLYRTALQIRASSPFTSLINPAFNRMASTQSNSTGPLPTEGHTLTTLPKSYTFTTKLTPDPLYPTPQSSHSTSRNRFIPRIVKSGLYTFIRPIPAESPTLLCVSPSALRDSNLSSTASTSSEFLPILSGKQLPNWDEQTATSTDPNVPSGSLSGYPWAQNYGGYQFGTWAGQLGDGRAISLFETTNPITGRRYELQLKGAGTTPYSRFADGKAVLRSSIREFVVSEALNALGIKTTRALALVGLMEAKIKREREEKGGIVARFAESWIRIGNFDLLRARGERGLLRQLADYVAEEVFGGWEAIPTSSPSSSSEEEEQDLLTQDQQNCYTHLFRHIVSLNAKTVASWQAYGFTNGVLNTDNTSIMGLSLDFGPFAFIDDFDPLYTPNHDDYELRYSYRNQPTIIWWNLVRLGEALGELMGAGSGVDDADFVAEGVKESHREEVIKRAEKIIMAVGEEYKSAFLQEYKRLMSMRLGLLTQMEDDFEVLFSELLDIMQDLKLDFHRSFRRLSDISLSAIATEQERLEKAGEFFHSEGVPCSQDEARKRIANWLEVWRGRIVEDWGDGDGITEERDKERREAMRKVNPKFVARGWVLDEVIRRVDQEGDRKVLDKVMKMALNPFEESWDGDERDREDEERWCGETPREGRDGQCSCSS